MSEQSCCTVACFSVIPDLCLFFPFSCAENTLVNKSLVVNSTGRLGSLSLLEPFDNWTFDSGLSLRICAM